MKALQIKSIFNHIIFNHNHESDHLEYLTTLIGLTNTFNVEDGCKLFWESINSMPACGVQLCRVVNLKRALGRMPFDMVPYCISRGI